MAISVTKPRPVTAYEGLPVVDTDPVVQPKEQVLTVIRTELMGGRFPHDVLIVGPEDWRVERAREIEVEALAQLGDPPTEVVEEFLPYNDQSLYFLAYGEGTDKTSENIQGMMRVIPQTEG